VLPVASAYATDSTEIRIAAIPAFGITISLIALFTILMNIVRYTKFNIIIPVVALCLCGFMGASFINFSRPFIANLVVRESAVRARDADIKRQLDSGQTTIYLNEVPNLNYPSNASDIVWDDNKQEFTPDWIYKPLIKMQDHNNLYNDSFMIKSMGNQ
jgi:hypothetical protein